MAIPVFAISSTSGITGLVAGGVQQQSTTDVRI